MVEEGRGLLLLAGVIAAAAAAAAVAARVRCGWCWGGGGRTMKRICEFDFFILVGMFLKTMQLHGRRDENNQIDACMLRTLQLVLDFRCG